MNLIPNVSADPLQLRTVVLDTGSVFTFTMYYVPQQFGWFITNITYGTFQIDSIRITNNPNMLYQFQHLIPFGLGCFSKSQREPTQQQDFASGSSSLYLLTQAECVAYSEYIKGGALPA